MLEVEVCRSKEECEALLRENPLDVSLHEQMGLTLRRLGHLKEAVEQMRRTLEMEPLEPRHYKNLAEVLLATCQAQRAGDLCQSALRLFPASHHFYRILADSYLVEIVSRTLDGEARRQNLYLAEETLKKGFHLNALDAELCMVQAKLCLMQGDEAEAADYLDWAVESGPAFSGDQIDVLLNLAILAARRGDTGALPGSITGGLDLCARWKDPHFIRLSGQREHLSLMAEVYLGKKINLKKYAEAFEECKKLVESGVQDNTSSRILRESLMGMLKKRSAGDVDGAVKELRHVVEHFEVPFPCIFYHLLKKVSLETVLNVTIGDLFLQKGKKRKAMIYYQKALKVSPRDPAARKRMEKM